MRMVVLEEGSGVLMLSECIGYLGVSFPQNRIVNIPFSKYSFLSQFTEKLKTLHHHTLSHYRLCHPQIHCLGLPIPWACAQDWACGGRLLATRPPFEQLLPPCS